MEVESWRSPVIGSQQHSWKEQICTNAEMRFLLKTGCLSNPQASEEAEMGNVQRVSLPREHSPLPMRADKHPKLLSMQEDLWGGHFHCTPARSTGPSPPVGCSLVLLC
ncbi:mCG147081 [Mus musculus]|uniref:Uncharacterized protein n=1 Tax=Mus musculus TaxID=10090 RepID=Q9D1H3_MOUSE|nr:mCG147081 [Mus musculus]BAB22861.1 unnamed protein product [Mus musculus]